MAPKIHSDGETTDEERASLLPPHSNKAISTAKSLHDHLASNPQYWSVEKQITVAFIAICFLAAAYVPILIGGKHLPFVVNGWLYGVSHIIVSLSFELIPAFASLNLIRNRWSEVKYGVYWSLLSGAFGGLQLMLLILTLVIDKEASVWVPLIVFHIVIGYLFSILFMHETLGGLRLLGVVTLILANSIIVIDKVNRTPLAGLAIVAYVLLGIRVLFLALLQPTVKKALQSGATYAISFQVSSIFGSLLDIIFATTYALVEGKWHDYTAAITTHYIMYPMIAIVLRSFGRILMRSISGPQDSIIIISFLSLSDHFGTILVLAVFPEPVTSMKIMGLMLAIPAILMITQSMRPPPSSPPSVASTVAAEPADKNKWNDDEKEDEEAAAQLATEAEAGRIKKPTNTTSTQTDTKPPIKTKPKSGKSTWPNTSG